MSPHTYSPLSDVTWYKTPINHSVLLSPDPVKNPITREKAIELLNPVIERITQLPSWGNPIIVGFTLRKPDGQSDPDYTLQVAEMEPAVRTEAYFKPRQSMYHGL